LFAAFIVRRCLRTWQLTRCTHINLTIAVFRPSIAQMSPTLEGSAAQTRTSYTSRP